MKAANPKTIALCLALVGVTLLTGCTDWKKKYEALNVEHQNLQGLLESERTKKGALEAQAAQDQQTIADLQAQIEQRNQSPADATGFGPGYDVAFDANAGTITVTLNNSILFDAGKASLKRATISELDHIYSVIKSKYSGRQIDVVGHTDSDPISKSNWADNWELSAERALTVTRYLVKKGLSEDKIKASGCGSARPVASNSSSTGKAKNRRVEIVVHMR